MPGCLISHQAIPILLSLKRRGRTTGVQRKIASFVYSFL
jgi:hypothetical protein